MLQQKLKLSTELKTELKECDEIWIAVAMISDNGFKYIQENIAQSAKQNFLIGIGLPTSPKVLQQLRNVDGNGIFNSRIHHKNNELFHPKAYIIKSNTKLIAYVGSGNCTNGGFEKNIELSIKTDDQQFCENLIKWFNALFKHSKKITDDFLLAYTSIFNDRIARLKNDRQEIKKLFPEENATNLDEIDFTGQFFKKEDFQAFEGKKPWDTSAKANSEREKVRSKLFRLNDKILPEIKSRKWNLAEHYVPNDIVSSAVHGAYTSDELSGIWLHYGRDKPEIKAYGKEQTPLDYMRLQVIVHKGDIGIWNRIGKDNGSRIDRDNLKSRLKNEIPFRKKFFDLINSLPKEYFIRMNNHKRYVREFETEEHLTKFLLEDDTKHYFIIGVELNPGDERISEENITKTIIDNFELLYPTYELIKHRLL